MHYAIINSSKLLRKLPPSIPVPELIELPQFTLQDPININNITHCLKILDITPFPINCSHDTFIDYISNLMKDDLHMFNYLNDSFTTYKLKYNHLNKIRAEEEATDRIEIKLTKLRDDYSFISNLANINIDKIRDDRLVLEHKFSKFDVNIDNKMKLFIKQIEGMDCNYMQSNIENITEFLEMLSYFGFLKDSNVLNEIKESISSRNQINLLRDSVKKRLCLALLKFKSVSINHFTGSQNVDRNEVMMIVIDMAFFGIVAFDNMDTVQLRE